MANVFAKSLLAVVVSCVASSGLAAQPEVIFKEAIQALRLGQKEDALDKFREVLKADPSNEQAWNLYVATDKDIWEELLLGKGEISKIAQHLMLKAREGRVAQSRDQDKIRALVDKACDKTYATYFPAMEELRIKHGAFAVPLLLAKLSDADDEQGVVNATLALQRIGHDATLPLIEALNSDSAVTRQNVCVALKLIGDRRSRAALARLASNDEDSVVQGLAGAALRRLNVDAGANAPALYREAALGYLNGSSSVGRDPGAVIWSFKEGKLACNDIPATLYWMELAKKNAEQALALDPADPEAQALVARSYLAQVAAIRSGAAAGDEMSKALTAEVPKLKMVAMAMGPKVLRKAFVDSDRQPLVKVAAAEALAETESKDTLADSPLVDGLKANNKTVRYASALALVKASRGDTLPNAEAVVKILGDAVTEEYVRRIFVVGEGPGFIKAVASSGRMRGQFVESAASAKEAIGELWGFRNADVIVINETLRDNVPDTVIGLVRKNPRFKNTKILIVATNADAATEQYGERIDGVIPGPITGATLSAAVEEALKDVADDPTRARAAKVAMDASAALSKLAGSRINIGPALQNLGTQLNRADDVAVAAANAIGEGGSMGDLNALVGAVAGAKGSEGLRVAAASAVGKILGRADQGIPADVFVNLTEICSTSDLSMKLRQAVVTAIGKARLNPGQRLQLSNALRTAVVTPKTDG